ncbi:VWA domain-containing protein, partial [bacterium]|nr:VWA domain-containing protein [bacterium]
MKKFLVVFAVLAAMILMVGCGGGSTTGDNTDTGTPETDEDSADSGSSDSGTTEPTDTGEPDTAPVPDQDADSGDSGVIEQMEEGIYLGIIGFNDDLTKKPIKRLTDTNKDEFKSFISSLTQLNLTALYWADYSALEMMENFTISPDLQLKKVALVTFTDGLDNQSLSSDDFNPGPYDSHADYLDAIHSMIMDEDGIHGQPVTAYSIGLKGEDVTDEAKFENTLEMLATEESGDEKFVFQVSDMSEVGQLFAEIAASLYSVSTTINVGVYIPGGYDNGQVIRYTFDNVAAAADSNLYIEATYHRSGNSRTLENIKYEGFIPGAPTISSSATGPHNELYFQFNDLKYSNGDPVSQSEIISKSRLWKQTSSGAWDGETEMNMAELPPIIDEDKSSALIMLVL